MRWQYDSGAVRNLAPRASSASTSTRARGLARGMLRALGLRPAWCLPLVDTVGQWARMSSRKAADAWARVEADAVYRDARKTSRKRAFRRRKADQSMGKERPRSEYQRMRREDIERKGLGKR